MAIVALCGCLCFGWFKVCAYVSDLAAAAATGISSLARRNEWAANRGAYSFMQMSLQTFPGRGGGGGVGGGGLGGMAAARRSRGE